MSQGTTAGRPPAAAAARQSPWAPLSLPTFRALWLANVVSDIGGAMHGVGAGWLMTAMSPSPLIVALVQAATMLPMFLLVMPAGVLGDILDRRKLLIFAQWWSVVSAFLLGVFTLMGWMSPWILLLFTFTLGVGSALATPPFQSIVPELVPRDRLPSAVALNSMGVNIARAAGPAIGGVLISLTGPASVFLFNAVSFLFTIFVLWRWKREPRINRLPPEQFFPAMRTGWRYARRNPQLQAVLARAAAFFMFAAALWALLPLIGSQKLEGSPNGYAILLSCLGVGAVSAAFTLPKLREKASADILTVAAAVAFAAATAVAAISDNFYLIAAFMVAAGWAWLASLSTFNVTAQFAIAEWVKGRGLAMYQIAFYGCQAIGSIVWGQVASLTSIATALLIASAGLLVGCMTAVKFKLGGAGNLNLQPSLHWQEPHVLLSDTAGRGAILTTVEYDIDPVDAAAFLKAMRELERSRRQNGGYGWGVYEDMEKPGRVIEHFLTDSWLEHLRHHERVTVADREVQDRVNAFHKGAAPPRVSHLAAPGAHDIAVQEPLATK
jgi:MFS family permease